MFLILFKFYPQLIKDKANFLSHVGTVTPQNVITIAAKCTNNAKCNKIDANCNKLVNAKLNVITFQRKMQ